MSAQNMKYNLSSFTKYRTFLLFCHYYQVNKSKTVGIGSGNKVILLTWDSTKEKVNKHLDFSFVCPKLGKNMHFLYQTNQGTDESDQFPGK